MTTTLTLFVGLACLGAFDTLYYHEWRAKLPAMGPLARSELQLHALRDFVYAVIFGTLPWVAWQGRYVLPLIVLLVVEIILTLWDFVVEDWIRKPLGGVYPGERVMHGIMGIAYGAALAYPWSRSPRSRVQLQTRRRQGTPKHHPGRTASLAFSSRQHYSNTTAPPPVRQ